jgi:AcrR family transcriptional regulator
MAERKDEIIDAAIAIADEQGLDAVSMRSVAQRVGVTPMALYPHVGSKTALLDAMYGRIVADLLPDMPADESWRDRLRMLAHAARALVQRRPWAITLLLARPSVTLDAVRITDAIYGALLEAGVPDPDVPRIERLVTTFFLGYLASEAGGRFAPRTAAERAERAALPMAELPAHARLLPWLAKADWEGEFDADLTDLADLIHAKALAPDSRPAGS